MTLLKKDFDDFPSGGIPFGKGKELPCVLRGQLGDGVSGCISSKGLIKKPSKFKPIRTKSNFK